MHKMRMQNSNVRKSEGDRDAETSNAFDNRNTFDYRVATQFTPVDPKRNGALLRASSTLFRLQTPRSERSEILFRVSSSNGNTFSIRFARIIHLRRCFTKLLASFGLFSRIR